MAARYQSHVLPSPSPWSQSLYHHCVPSAVLSPYRHCRGQRRFDVKGVAGAAATLAAGDDHTVALKEGHVFMFGTNTYGQLGLGQDIVGVPRMLQVVLA